MLDFLKYLLLFNSFLGILVTGALFFQKKNKAAKYLGIFILLFSLEQLDFLYVTSPLLYDYPKFYMILFPGCLLFGPSLWYHLKGLYTTDKLLPRNTLWHLIPFIIYSIYTLYLMSYSGQERLIHVRNNFFDIIMPLNYGKAIHVSIYGILMFRFAQKQHKKLTLQKKQYLLILVGMYVFTAVIQAYLTVFVENYNYFISYFVLTSFIILIVAYVLQFRPEILMQIQKKYFNSSLTLSDKKRIAQKIENYFSKKENYINPKINLASFCTTIKEKKHHVSQTLSEVYQLSFNDLLNQKRIEHAKKMLGDPSFNYLKILAVALESGFRNKNTFNRAFIKFTHCTPSQYRLEKQVTSNYLSPNS